jgi:16S rRNA (cytidine1402-2'-O)-methyltransferase
MPGILFLVATPIGNLEDMTVRGLRTLKEVDLIACEDTRVAAKLLSVLELPKKPMVAIHEHADERKVANVVDQLKKGMQVAFVSDAGTPGVNDPGGKLVEAAFEAGMTIVPIPGPSALTAAISVCGFPMDDFTYLGFAPHKKGRETFFREVAERKEASVFLESTHRIGKAMESLAKELDPKRGIFIGRELTKMHETLYRGTVGQVSASLASTSLKGEFTIIIAPARFTL